MISQITLMGRPTRDITVETINFEKDGEKRSFKKGMFNLAVNKSKDKVYFFHCVVTGSSKRLNYFEKIVKQGKRIWISGSAEPDVYEKDGVKQRILNVIIREIEPIDFLESEHKSEDTSDFHEVSPNDDGFMNMSDLPDDMDTPFK